MRILVASVLLMPVLAGFTHAQAALTYQKPPVKPAEPVRSGK